MTANEVYFAQSAAKDLYLSSLKLVTAWGGELTEAEQRLLMTQSLNQRTTVRIS